MHNIELSKYKETSVKMGTLFISDWIKNNDLYKNDIKQALYSIRELKNSNNSNNELSNCI